MRYTFEGIDDYSEKVAIMNHVFETPVSVLHYRLFWKLDDKFISYEAWKTGSGFSANTQSLVVLPFNLIAAMAIEVTRYVIRSGNDYYNAETDMFGPKSQATIYYTRPTPGRAEVVEQL